jgi:hypothetical protein
MLAVLVVAASACELKPPSAGHASPSTAVTSPSPSPSPQPTPIAITTPAFHSGEQTVAYTPVALAATGGTPPYQWAVAPGGALPGGLALSADGAVSGTPTAAGTFNFDVHVSDTGGRTADAPGAINVIAAPSAALNTACAQYCAVEQGCDSSCGPFGSVAGGTPPYTAAVQGGYVPKGVSVTVAGPTLAMAGTFTSPAKFWQFTVLVTDALGATATISPTFYVYSHISVLSGSCDGNFGNGCGIMVPISGGTPGGTPTVQLTSNVPNTQGCYSSGPPPAGYQLYVSGGYLTVIIPKGISSGYGAVWTLTLTDQSQCAANVSCSTTSTISIKVICG